MDERRAQFVETHMFQAFLEDRTRVALGGLAAISDWAPRTAASEVHADDGSAAGGADNESELLSRCAQSLGCLAASSAAGAVQVVA